MQGPFWWSPISKPKTKQKRKSGDAFRSWIQKFKKNVFPPKCSNNIIWLKFIAGKGAICLSYLWSPTPWNATLNICSPNENMAIQNKCCLDEPYHKRWGILLQFCSSLFSLDLGPRRIPGTACVTVASSPWCEVAWQHNETKYAAE